MIHCIILRTHSEFILLCLLPDHLLKLGGLDKMYEINKNKADMLYKCIDESSGFYKGHAEKESRSLMNVTFNLATPEMEKNLLMKLLKLDLTD